MKLPRFTAFRAPQPLLQNGIRLSAAVGRAYSAAPRCSTR